MTTETTPPPATVDVTGLSGADVWLVRDLVERLRKGPSAAGDDGDDDGPMFETEARQTDEEFERWLLRLKSLPPVPTLPADWSRADLYDDHD